MPQLRVDIGIRRAADDGAIRAEAHLVKKSGAAIGAEHTLDRIWTVGDQRLHARDHGIVLFLDVAKVGQLPCQLYDEFNGWLDIARAAGSLDEHRAVGGLAE